MAPESSHPPPHQARVVPLLPQRTVTVLAISGLEADHSSLAHIFSHSKWRIHGARSRREALLFLSENPVPVVICEKDLPDGTWKEILSELADFKDSPLLIVTSQLADDSLWAEVLNLGGYDVLMKPFDSTEVVRVVSLAWRHWQDNWERTRETRTTTKVIAAGA